MENDDPILQRDSSAWVFCVKASFVLAAGAMGGGIAFLPCDWWMRGFLAIGALYLTTSTFSLAKTMRDQHEAERLLRQVSDARTKKILKEYGEA